MINANVIKHSNKKWNIHEEDIVEEVRRPQLQQLDIQEIIQEPPENEQRIEDMIQKSGNVVSNIEDITLKEAAIGEVLPPNDGFGEERLDPLQLLQDRTIEMMLVQPDVSTVHSGLEIALDVTDKSHDKSRLLEPLHAQMERISEHDLTMFRKSTGGELMPDFEKDIPEIPEVPNPEMPAPEPDKIQEERRSEIREPGNVIETEQHKVQEPVLDMVTLEELEALEPLAKRRKIRKLIIDKKTKISTNHFRARIENPLVELRCEDSSDDIIFIRVPVEEYFRRPCHGGHKIISNFGDTISRLFGRNLGIVPGLPLAEREMEQAEAVRRRSRRTTKMTMLDIIEEEQEATVVRERPEIQVDPPIPETSVTMERLNISEPPRVSAQVDIDIADLPTQNVETLSQARKRTAEPEMFGSPKRQRSMGYISFRESQLAKDLTEINTEAEKNKENIPANIIPTIPQPPQDAELILSSKLQEVGLADIPQPITAEVEVHSQMHRPLTTSQGRARVTGSERSETPLGSLDRTKVSLGDSEQTTDSKRFIRDQWGTEGTMIKIMKHIKASLQPVTVKSLLDKGPVISGYKELKQHGFVNVTKNPDTLEIVDVTLGPKLTSSSDQF
ncbi:unnamed protein product [Spodoptera exigua]|nr:unnamed protein product [Spodoptera exigua]